MDMGENYDGLMCSEKYSEWTHATIRAEPTAEKKKSKDTKKEFSVFRIPVVIKDLDNASIQNLLRSQLNPLVAKFGKESTQWIGKEFEFRSVVDGDYRNWELRA